MIEAVPLLRFIAIPTWMANPCRTLFKKKIGSASQATIKDSQTCITDLRHFGYFGNHGKNNVPLTSVMCTSELHMVVFRQIVPTKPCTRHAICWLVLRLGAWNGCTTLKNMDLHPLGISLGRIEWMQNGVTRKSWKCFSGNYPTDPNKKSCIITFK